MTVHTTQHFDCPAAKTSDLMRRYADLYKAQRRGLTDDERIELSALKTTLINDRLQLVELSPDEVFHQPLLQQLAGKDKVQEFGSQTFDEINQYRNGGARANKTIMALVQPDHENGPKVMAAIYLFRSMGLPNNVSRMLDVNLEIVSDFDHVVPYSISSFGVMAGEGQMLIEAMHKQLNIDLFDKPGVKIATMSPLRSFAKFMSENKSNVIIPSAPKGDYVRRKYAAQYLRTATDGVAKFHWGNGAIGYEVHPCAADEGGTDAIDGLGVMVSHHYPRDPTVLAHNIQLFKTGQYDALLAPRLREVVGLSRDIPERAFVSEFNS